MAEKTLLAETLEQRRVESLLGAWYCLRLNKNNDSSLLLSLSMLQPCKAE